MHVRLDRVFNSFIHLLYAIIAGVPGVAERSTRKYAGVHRYGAKCAPDACAKC